MAISKTNIQYKQLTVRQNYLIVCYSAHEYKRAINVSNVKHGNKTTLDRTAIDGPVTESVECEPGYFRQRIAEVHYAVSATHCLERWCEAALTW
jgi:hypothetical protein